MTVWSPVTDVTKALKKTPGFTAPDRDCNLCPRLAAFREENRSAFPDKHNAPVPAFGELSASLLIVGLAPGLRGANFTGRPFTGDYAGDLLYKTLSAFDFATGTYDRRADDGYTLVNCRVTNAVRCLPPENKPVGAEIAACRSFLEQEIAAMENLRVIVALGSVAHTATVRTLGGRLADYKFAHNAVHDFDGLTLIDSYHCSRYNTNTGRLTEDMFFDVFKEAQARL